MAIENDKKVEINYDTAIKKSNELSLAKLSHGMTLQQTQLLSFSIYRTGKERKAVFKRKEFMDCFGIKDYKTNQAKSDIERMSKLQFSLIDLEDDHVEYWNFFSGISYHRGTFTITWTPELLPHIQNLRGNFILTDLVITTKFRSIFSWTLYDMLKAHHNYHYKEYSMEALYKLFSVEGKNSYRSNTALFRRSVLDIAIADINAHTEYNVAAVPLKKGRKTTGFRFEWSKGDVEIAATEKQMEAIRTILNGVQKELFHYMAVDDPEKLMQSRDILQSMEDLRVRVDSLKLSYEDAEGLIKKLTLELGVLSANAKYTPPTVTFYNWLDERD